MLTNKELNLSGWMSVLSAVVTVPLIAFGFYLGMLEEETTVMRLIEFGLSALYTVLFVYVSLKFRKLLNQHANFHDVDIYILLLIWINIVFIAISIIPIFYSEISAIIDIITVIAFLPMGIILIMFGIKLLNCKAEFSPKLKYFAIFTIITGVFVGSIILIIFSFITSIVTDIILAAIFFSELDRDRIEKEGYGVIN